MKQIQKSLSVQVIYCMGESFQDYSRIPKRVSLKMGPVYPSFLVVKKSHLNKNIHLIASLQTPQNRKYIQVVNTVKHALSSNSKKKKTKILVTNGSLMKVERIAECPLEHSVILLICIKL